MSATSPAFHSHSWNERGHAASNPRFDWSDQFGYSSERSFTESGPLTRTNSPSTSGPENAETGSVDFESSKSSRFNLVKQLFTPRRDSVLSELETAEGDHSKSSSETDSNRPRQDGDPLSTGKHQQRRLSSSRSHDVDIENCTIIIAEGNDAPHRHQHEPPGEKLAEASSHSAGPDLVEESCELDIREISSFRSWPLELRGRAAEWCLCPSVC